MCVRRGHMPIWLSCSVVRSRFGSSRNSCFSEAMCSLVLRCASSSPGVPQRTLHSSHTNVSGCVDLSGREEGEDGRGRWKAGGKWKAGEGGKERRKGRAEGRRVRQNGGEEWKGGKEDGRREHYSTNANLMYTL